MSAPIPRFLFPRKYMLPYVHLPKSGRPRQTACSSFPTSRNASASTSKTRVLEKPTKFNPPSHGKRLKEQLPRQYGPQLTAEQKVEQKTKKYPNTMPAPGTFMYWFLTTKSIHTFLSVGVLVLLAFITSVERWRNSTFFREQLPEASDFLYQPLTALYQAWEVYAMDVTRKTGINLEKRQAALDDIQKRNTYRIEHGTLDPDANGLGGWPPAEEILRKPVGVEPGQEVEITAVMRSRDGQEKPIHDMEGRKRQPVKKWLGIW